MIDTHAHIHTRVRILIFYQIKENNQDFAHFFSWSILL